MADGLRRFPGLLDTELSTAPIPRPAPAEPASPGYEVSPWARDFGARLAAPWRRLGSFVGAGARQVGSNPVRYLNLAGEVFNPISSLQQRAAADFDPRLLPFRQRDPVQQSDLDRLRAQGALEDLGTTNPVSMARQARAAAMPRQQAPQPFASPFQGMPGGLSGSPVGAGVDLPEDPNTPQTRGMDQLVAQIKGEQQVREDQAAKVAANARIKELTGQGYTEFRPEGSVSPPGSLFWKWGKGAGRGTVSVPAAQDVQEMAALRKDAQDEIERNTIQAARLRAEAAAQDPFGIQLAAARAQAQQAGTQGLYSDYQAFRDALEQKRAAGQLQPGEYEAKLAEVNRQFAIREEIANPKVDLSSMYNPRNLPTQ